VGHRAVRRKILQGTLAAPMVLTVSSASAQAITSFGRCLRNLTAQQPTDFFRISADLWYRELVQCVEIIKGSTSQGTYYFDPKFGSYMNVVTVRHRWVYGRGSARSILKFGTTSMRWALVYFDPVSTEPYADATGKTIVTLQKPGGFLATTMSCYGSVARPV
jgi:hypothetical protein